MKKLLWGLLLVPVFSFGCIQHCTDNQEAFAQVLCVLQCGEHNDDCIKTCVNHVCCPK